MHRTRQSRSRSCRCRRLSRQPIQLVRNCAVKLPATNGSFSPDRIYRIDGVAAPPGRVSPARLHRHLGLIYPGRLHLLVGFRSEPLGGGNQGVGCPVEHRLRALVGQIAAQRLVFQRIARPRPGPAPSITFIASPQPPIPRCVAQGYGARWLGARGTSRWRRAILRPLTCDVGRSADGTGAGDRRHAHLLRAPCGRVRNPGAIFYGRRPRFRLSGGRAGRDCRRRARSLGRASRRRSAATPCCAPGKPVRSSPGRIRACRSAARAKSWRFARGGRTRWSPSSKPTRWNFYEPPKYDDDETMAEIAARIERFGPGRRATSFRPGRRRRVARRCGSPSPVPASVAYRSSSTASGASTTPATANILRVTLGQDLAAPRCPRLAARTGALLNRQNAKKERDDDYTAENAEDAERHKGWRRMAVVRD